MSTQTNEIELRTVKVESVREVHTKATAHQTQKLIETKRQRAIEFAFRDEIWREKYRRP